MADAKKETTNRISISRDNLSRTSQTKRNSVKVVELISKEDFSAYLTCPVCYDTPIPPVYTCTTGHLICGPCRKKVKSCGLCNAPFTGGRNFFYESMFDNTSFLCRYAANGCNSKFLGKELKMHQDTCAFRALPCIKHGCVHAKDGNLVEFSNFVEHFVEAHGGRLNKNRNSGKIYNGFPSDTDTWGMSRWAHEVYEYQNHYFFVTCQVRKPEVGIWLWVLGTDDVAEQFRVTFTLEKASSHMNKRRMSLTWNGPVHSIRKSAEAVMDSGECMLTSLSTIKYFCIDQRSTQAADVRKYWEIQFEVVEDTADANTPRILHANVTTRKKCNRIPEEFSAAPIA